MTDIPSQGLDDIDMKDLALQLSGHVESMSANLQQAEGIAQGMSSSRAALQDVLLRHLDLDQYERVNLG
jgi:hypothetical protein